MKTEILQTSFLLKLTHYHNCPSNAMHGQNINLPVCVRVCPSHFLSTRLQVRPLTGFLQMIA